MVSSNVSLTFFPAAENAEVVTQRTGLPPLGTLYGLRELYRGMISATLGP